MVLPWYVKITSNSKVIKYFKFILFSSSNDNLFQETIELNTFPHKYKRVRRQSELDDENSGEKCIICLSLFEIENDVR